MSARRAARALLTAVALAAVVAAPPSPAGPAPARAETVRLTLADALARADAASASLGALAAQRDAARAAARRETGARLPQVSLSAGYSKLSDVPVFALPGFPEPLFPNIPHAAVARADLTLPLFTGLRLEKNAAAAARESRASESDLAAGRAAVRLETVRAYWTLVSAREQRATAERALAAFDAHAKQAADRRRQGLVTANEVLAVEVERDRTEVQRLRAEAAAEVAQANLARLTGLPEDAALEPDTTDAADADTTVAGESALVGRAMEARPELRAAAARTGAAGRRAGAARGALLPQISLLASALTARPNERYFPRTDEWNSSWSVGVSATWSILDGGRTWAEAAQRAALARAAELQREDLARRVRLDVLSRRLDLVTAIRAQRVAELALAAAVENERVARDRYREGVLASSELLDAEVAHREAELERVRAVADRRVARAALAAAVGD